MNRFAFAVCLLIAGLAASTPARADFAVVRFGDGFCKIWSDSADNPWGTGWTKIALGLPDYLTAQAALAGAHARATCR
jgi:hypothetical protein